MPRTTLLSTADFNPLPIGGGGWVTGGCIADDGYVVARTDTTNAFIKAPSAVEWTRAFVADGTNTATADVAPHAAGAGCYDIGVCKTDSQKMAAIIRGNLMMSTNRGATWTKNTAYGSAGSNGANNNNRMHHRHVEYDPSSAAVLAVASRGQGLRYTLDSGATWTTHPDIPTPTTGDKGITIAFDRSSTFSGGQTQIVYVGVEDYGIYRSTTGISGTFALIASTPTTVAGLAVHEVSGKLWMSTRTAGTSEAGTQLYCWTSGGGWVTITGLTAIKGVVCHPTDVDKVWAFNGGTGLWMCTNASAATPTFTQNTNTPTTKTANDIPWLAWTNEYYLSNGDLLYDRLTNKGILLMGIGAFEIPTMPTTNVAWSLTSITKGIENLVAMHVEINPDGLIMLGAQDRPHFVRERNQVASYPSKHGPGRSVSIQHGGTSDYACDDPDWICSVGSNTSQQSYYSTDRGLTYNYFPDQPAEVVAGALGGNIAVGNAGNCVYLPSNHVGPYYKPDINTAWAQCQLVGAEAYSHVTAHQMWHHSYTIHRKILINDKNNPTHFYLYCVGKGDGSAADLASRGMWKSTDGGATFNRVRTTLISTWVLDFWNSKLKQVPGQAGHFWWTAGPVGNPGDAAATNKMYFSTDYCVTWTALSSGPSECRSFAFGKAKEGASYPTILAAAENDGLKFCQDFNPASHASATWQSVGGLYADGDFEYIQDIGGDPNLYGRFVIAREGEGWQIMEMKKTVTLS